jgi:hypothetical protein
MNLDNAGQMGNKKSMRIMGLDVGTHTIGMAISDELGLTAQGLKTLGRKSMEEDFTEIVAIIHQFGIEKIVVGLPKNMNGTLGKQAEFVLKWSSRITFKFLWSLGTNGFQRSERPGFYWKQISQEEKGRRLSTSWPPS